MSGSFTVGALAIARPEANAVGAVRITLLPKRIELELLLVGSYTDSFVPGALTRSVRMSAPYTAVRGLVRRDDGVTLTFDSRVVLPFNRFVLVHFTDLPLEALASVHKKRARTAMLATLLPLPLALAAALLVPGELASGALGRGALAILVLVASATALRLAVRLRSYGGPLSDQLQSAFEHRLAQRLAIEPAASFETDPFDPPETRELRPEPAPAPRALQPAPAPVAIEPAPAALAIEPARLLVEPPPPAEIPSPSIAAARHAPPPRARGLVFAALGVITVVAGLAGYRAIERAETPGRASATVEVSEPSPPAAPSSEGTTTSAWPTCRCAHADSPLWKDGLPVLTLIPISRQRDDAGRPASNIAPVVTKGVPRYDFDMAVVNDAAVPLKDVRVVLTFARRNKRGERTNVTDRGLFWEGELGPGRSVKWNVEAPGSEVRIDVDERRKLGDVPAAPADAFVKLLGARQPSVRLHAAVMLAYLGDGRARDAATGLSDLSDADERVRQMVLRASAPLRVCDLKAPEKGALEACLDNTSDHDEPELDLVEIAPEGGGRRVSFGEPLAASTGRRVRFGGFGELPEELSLVPRR